MSFSSQGSSLIDRSYISVRVVTLDYYMAPPIVGLDPTFSSSRSHVVRRVPVLRIFGPTAAGQKSCLHLHGIFPYLYVPMPQSDSDEGFANRLCASLDRALNLSLATANSSTSPQQQQQHVFKAQEVSGVPFYGYHPREHRLLKLFFYNPMLVKRAAEMLLNGAVMGMRLQPHESHVPFTLQFMMDFNLQGMNFIHLSHAKFRRKAEVAMSDEELLRQIRRGDDGAASATVITSQGSDNSWLSGEEGPAAAASAAPQLSEPSKRLFDVNSLPDSMLMGAEVLRVSTSQLEIDAVAADILNTNDSASGVEGMNPGLEAIWEDERIRRRLLGIEEDLTPPSSPPRDTACNMTDSEKFWQDRFREKLDKIRQDPERFVSETGESQSSDVNATCNFNPGGAKEEVYAAESQLGLSLPSATLVESHVPTLSGASTTPRDDDDLDLAELSQHSDVAAAAASSLDDTIVDEVVALSSQNSSRLLAEHAALFDEDDEELVELLAELGVRRGNETSTSAEIDEGHVGALSRTSSKLKQKEEEDEEETFEMSQVVEDEEAESDGSDHKGEPEKKKRSQQAMEDPNDLWGGSADDSFWENLDIN